MKIFKRIALFIIIWLASGRIAYWWYYTFPVLPEFIVTWLLKNGHVDNVEDYTDYMMFIAFATSFVVLSVSVWLGIKLYHNFKRS